MKVKVEKVVNGIYEYDSIIVKINGKDTEIVFRKEEKVLQYEGKEVELVNSNGIFKIKPVVTTKLKK